MAESLAGCLDDLLALMPKARKARINEANTKATLIEPMLSALGWEVSNFAEVEHERPMYDGTHVDYALHVDGKPVAFIEAKPLGANLDAPKAIAQTVNYANQAGVVWCVLTDGNRYMLFKSNEHARAPDKLLLEVRLEEARESSEQRRSVLQKLRRFTKSAMDSADLEEWASTVFLDKAVRLALDASLGAGDRKLALLLRGHLPNKKVAPRAMQDSLQRIAGQARGAEKRKGAVPKPKPQPHTIESHLRGKPGDIGNLYQQLHARILALGPDIERRPTKFYIAYRRTKNFACVELRRTRLLVYISILPSTAPIQEGPYLRDVSKVGHYGSGNVEASLGDSTHLDEVTELIRRAYQGATLSPGASAARMRKLRA